MKKKVIVVVGLRLFCCNLTKILFIPINLTIKLDGVAKVVFVQKLDGQNNFFFLNSMVKMILNPKFSDHF